jgi:transcriptional regulator with XRE-family HTH domain
MIMDFKTFLEQRCKYLGISQREVSRRSGVSVGYLTELKKPRKGTLPFSRDRRQLLRLAEALEVPVEEVQDCFVNESEYIDKTLRMELHEDKRIKEIVEKWMWSDEPTREVLYNIFMQLNNLSPTERQKVSNSLSVTIKSSWPHAKNADKYLPHSDKRALFIWRNACKDIGVGEIFNPATVDNQLREYKRRSISDAELYNHIIETIEEIKESLK